MISFHKVIFEQSAQAGFPEVLFNLFPGMGGWNFVIRKSGFAIANEMILSGACLRPNNCSAGIGRHGGWMEQERKPSRSSYIPSILT